MKMIKVFKFGGASIKDADGFRNVKKILEQFPKEQLVIVVSALGKTTNALEEIAHTYFNKGNATPLLESLKQKHVEILDQLFADKKNPVYDEVNNTFVEIDWILEDTPAESYDYLYDQIVSIGEMASTKMLAAYLFENKLPVKWMDARDLIRTDNTYREGKINWELTEKMVREKVTPVLAENKWVLTQGFLGGTSENFTTTLGREGSDYTAAALAYCLGAESVTIWKDVPGVLNADPRYFPKAQKIDKLGYLEAIEMTYYGATVIHPKTIKPLQNKGIPMNVRSFIQPAEAGTNIAESHDSLLLPAIMVLKKNQVLISISAKDFSFIAEENLGYIYNLLSKYRIKSNMMQNAAISFSICADNDEAKVKPFVEELSQHYHTLSNDKLELLTVRHYTDSVLSSLTAGRNILMEQKTRNTAQLVMKEN